MPADTDGRWRAPRPVPFKEGVIRDKRGAKPITDRRGLFVIHAVHLRTGKVLWFCGHAETLDYPLVSYLFDPKNPTAPAVPKPFPGKADLFCCHYVQLADGRILVVGGSQIDHVPAAAGTWDPVRDYRGNSGSSTIAIFDPRPGKEDWAVVDPARRLSQSRWYPTAVLLGDGSVLVFSGRREALETTWTNPQIADWVIHRGIADKVEHLRPPKFRSQTVTGASRVLPIYPGIHLAPDDRLYTTHTNWGQEIPEPPTLSLTVVPPPSGSPAGTRAVGTWTEYVRPTARARQPEREEGMSVMLPVVLDPATKVRRADSVGKFLVIGGGFAVDAGGRGIVRKAVIDPTPPFAITDPQGPGTVGFHHQSIASRNPAEILDVSAPGAPRWTAVPGLTHPRINGHCVLLPDATVAILGGHNAYKWHASANSTAASAKGVARTTPTLPVELFTPGAGFHVGTSMAHPRMYHSIAMLLADGSVIVAGGADPNEHEPPLAFPVPWEGRSYLSTTRRLMAASAGATSVTVDLSPSVYSFPLPDMPVGTRVIIDPGPSQISTTATAFRSAPGNAAPVFLDLAAPLPSPITAGTLVEFQSAGAGSPLPRKNDWLTIAPGIDRFENFSTPLNRKDYEVYEPPYFHKAGTRPVLPPLKPGEVQVRYGSTFTVRTPDAARITRVAIMRPAAVTHHTDSEQRFIELKFAVAGSTLRVEMVPGSDSSLAPPGYYMLWILAGNLPCVEARFIQLTGAPALRSPTVPVEVAPPPSPSPGSGDG